LHCYLASLNGNRFSAYEMFICINNFVITFLMTEILWCLSVDPEVCCTFPTALWRRIVLKLCEGEFSVRFPEVNDVGSFSDCVKVESVISDIFKCHFSNPVSFSVAPMRIYLSWMTYVSLCSLLMLIRAYCIMLYVATEVHWNEVSCIFMFTLVIDRNINEFHENIL
jgi:hypothetical protein